MRSAERPRTSVHKLSGRPDDRLRVGDSRITFSKVRDFITIHDIGLRSANTTRESTMTHVRTKAPNGDGISVITDALKQVDEMLQLLVGELAYFFLSESVITSPRPVSI